MSVDINKLNWRDARHIKIDHVDWNQLVDELLDYGFIEAPQPLKTTKRNFSLGSFKFDDDKRDKDLYAVDFDGNIYVIAEHYEAGKDIEYHSNAIKSICNKLNWFTVNGKYCALIDSAANQKTLASVKSVTELFYEQGIIVNPKVNKDVISGISKVKTYLKNINGQTKLFIFKNCTNLIREFKTYRWKNVNEPVKHDDHCLDELRYYIMSLTPKTTIQIKNEIQKHKEKLYKQLMRL